MKSVGHWIWLLSLALPAGGRGAEPALPHYRPIPGLAGTIHSVGSNKLDAITFGWIELCRHYYPNVRLTIEARGQSSAAPALLSGAADVAPAVLTFTPRQVAEFRARYGYPPLLLRVCGGSFDGDDGSEAVAVYVHRDNPIRGLTLADLDATFSSTRWRGRGDAVTWGDLGLTGEWAGRRITLYGSKVPSHAANAFRDIVLLHGDFRSTMRERSQATEAETLAQVVAAVAGDPSAIGFAGFAQARPEVRAVAIAEAAPGPYVAGSPDTVRERTYPLPRFGYFYLNRRPGQPLPPALREFLRLILSAEGQAVAARDGAAMPLPARIVAEERAKIE